MPIAIALRTTLATSHFRNAMITALNSGVGTEALICSGFFQENIGGGGYQASLEPGFQNALLRNNIVVDTIGVYNGIWRPQYEEFVDNLRAAGIPITAWYIPGFKWHAKIFILSNQGVPLFGIVGSSNMTSRAFGAGGANFNYECDTILWDANNGALNAVMTDLLRGEEFAAQIIYAEYDPVLNFGITIVQRLEELLDQIASTGLEPIL